LDVTISAGDSRSLLGILEYTLRQYDYATPHVFSFLLHAVIHSYVRGRGIKLDGVHQQKQRDDISLQIADTLWEYASDNAKYVWFVEWVKRLDKSMKEREVRP